MPGFETPDPTDSDKTGQQFDDNTVPPAPAGYIAVANGDGTFAWTNPSGLTVGTATTAGSTNVVDGVTVTGTPSTGQVITATSPTAAHWATPS